MLDSRRLTGPNLLWNRCGAVIDVRIDDGEHRVINLWQGYAEKILKALGWNSQQTCTRIYPNGASLAISAPVDVLYTATEINEWCWQRAVNNLTGKGEPDIKNAADSFTRRLDDEANPAVLALKQVADQNRIPFLRDDDEVSLGLGRHGRTWNVSRLPDAGDLDLRLFKSIPVGLITGTNGKTTSVRLAAHIARTAGLNAGISSTDWIAVNDQIIDTGDYSGPGGARRVLRDNRVDIAILETARGGLLRRGLGVERADAALITNIADDHMGEFGVQTLDELADVKWIVTSVIDRTGHAVLNADDPLLVSRGQGSGLNIVWFSADSDNSIIRHSIANSGRACTVERERIVYYQNSIRHDILMLADVPITLGGAALHNVQNTLGVVSFTHALGISLDDIRQGLRTFTDKDNPGRCNQFIINGVSIIVDFAHNPHGMKAFITVARNLAGRRKILVTGQAGDRSDEDIKQLARESMRDLTLDKVIIKHMPKYNRGRKNGETAQILKKEYIQCGLDEDRISLVEDELDAVSRAIHWAKPGDLVLLLIHENRSKVLDMLNAMTA